MILAAWIKSFAEYEAIELIGNILLLIKIL